MKLHKTLILPVTVAALVIVVGAGAVLASTGAGAGGTGASGVSLTASTPTAAPARKAPVLTGVLDGLVANGTITSAQEQAILGAWTAEQGTLAAQRRADIQQLRKFLADGVLTQAELNQLPANSPLRQLAPLMKNGQLTVAQIRALGLGILRNVGLGGVGRLGGARVATPNGAAPTASPTTGG